jgi:hypothetical protein
MSAVAQAYVDLLRRSPDVPEHVIAGVLGAGPAVVEPLVALLNDRSTDAADHPAGGMARAHAAELLGHVGDPAAIEPLLEVLVADRARPSMVKACAGALARLGDVSGPAFRRAQATPVRAEQLVLAMIIAAAGRRQPDITAWFAELLDAEPDLVLPLIARYGDRSLAPPVGQVLLASADRPQRVAACVGVLQVLGVNHPKLQQLAKTAADLTLVKVGQQMLDDLRPEIERLSV